MNELHPDNANLPVVNRPETVLGCTITFLTIACLAIALRLYVRYRERIWGWDDLIVLFAGFWAITGNCIVCLMPAAGMGHHFWTLDGAHLEEYFKWVWASNLTYTASTTFIKLAILFQYLRLFDMQSNVARRITKSMIIFVACWGISFFFLALFSCVPIKKNWIIETPGKCVAWGSKNGDVLFATRMFVLSQNRAGTVPIFDPTFAAPAVFIFSVLEVNIAILCASIPIFWPYVSSLAANKILVVNEIEVRTSRRESSHFDGLERGNSGGGAFVGIPDLERERAGNGRSLSRMSSIMGGAKAGLQRNPSHNNHSNHYNGNSKYAHSHKPSKSSANNSITAIELGHRVSHESSRNLRHAQTPSISSSTRGHDGGTVEEQRSGSIGSQGRKISCSYDRYVKEWAFPDFDVEGLGRGRGGKPYTTTTVERAEIPFDHIKALEN
ncbi:hypothetical protein BCR34DRAFT_500434 [Clohesyomyces aquaticus]|uniref:Rhodopsin domain-containing protein n=1 Tax=Clohesyomyces aquaticus TaxID=1231657 RepID=A0A1Y1Y485_9PLEO|nr:hypothetical protein BCR34DRAFT_500434 [Clohesyomyces aquaticus]